MNASLFDLAPAALALTLFCATLVGFSKSGVPGTGTFAIPLMAWIFPAGPSTGIFLPMLVIGDIFAVSYYHRHAEWKYVLRPMSWAVLGILAGYASIKCFRFSDVFLRRMIGVIVLGVLAFGAWLGKRQGDVQVPHRWWFAALTGILGGFTTMTANAAGPIWIVYLLAMNLPKSVFLGTNGYIFLILNVFKIPFSYNLGFITGASLLFNLKMAPAIALGAYLGIRTARFIPQKAFDATVRIFTALAAVKLLM